MMSGFPLVFASPWLLLALPALPLLWWLLRVTPPAPRTETFPAIRLLARLRATVETPAHTPWWLLLLRMLAAALIIVGLARPVLNSTGVLTGHGPVLVVMDDDWSTATDWPARAQAAFSVLDRAERAGRRVALLTTSADEAGLDPRPTPLMQPADLRPLLAALRPKPWPADRLAVARALATWQQDGTTVAFVANGLTQPGDARFGQALARAGAVLELRPDVPAARLLLPPEAAADQLTARVAQVPRPLATQAAVLAQTGDGRTLARAEIGIPAGAAAGEAVLKLPGELRNQLSRLVLAETPSAGAVVLLDERWRRRPVGLLAGDAAAADTPLTGELFYLRRALEPYTELREGDLASLLARDISVIVLADQPLSAGADQDALAAWVRKGGLLIRFAGPRMAEATAGLSSDAAAPGAPPDASALSDAAGADALLPVRLLAGERQLGGAMSWSQPAGLAPFAADSPFAGLKVPDEVTVTRQVLAEPSASLAGQSWARLADGTPLVTEAPRGAGRIVLFHTTANADWSNLALSGDFVEMLRRLVALSAGVATPADATPLAPVESLDGYGQLGPPPQAAVGLDGRALATATPSPRHPPGLYGPENGRRALNLSAGVAPPVLAPPLAGARQETLDQVARERALGPDLLAAALALLAFDLLIALRIRGFLGLRGGGTFWRRGGAAVLLLLAAGGVARAAPPDPLPPDFPALATRLAYVATGNDTVDSISRSGLAGLTDYVNRRTAANLGDPAAIHPGQDDLSFYPLVYWPIDPGTPPPGREQIAALNDYMSHGGILLIDTRDGGSGAGMNPGAEAALRADTAGLVVPPLMPLSTDHVLARAFYLLDNFPGRYAGDTVWVQRDQDRANDSVSPVIIGGHDWAAAWAVDGAGRNPYATLPGGARQRTLAYRFGVNLVMYALTGNYKGDQVHVPAILERLGQ
jgi:hypothetical protein